jgi:hypothetical protein
VLRNGKDYVMERMLKIAIIISLSCFLYADPPGYYSVGPENCDYTDIQSAIDDATGYYHIEVYAGTYQITSPIDFKGKYIRVFSRDGADDTTIEMTSSGCVVEFDDSETGSAELIGFTITGGTGQGSITKRGGGIYIDDAGPQIEDCIIEGNSADEGTGVYASDPTSSFLLDNCVVKNNAANANSTGREIYLFSGSGRITDCTVMNDDSQNDALGGIFLVSMASSFTLEESSIQNNNGPGVELYPTFRTSRIANFRFYN